MKNPLLKLFLFASAFVLAIIFFFPGDAINIADEHESDERPHYSIDPNEQAFYDKISAKKQQQIRMKGASLEEVYADGKIKGVWSAKQFSATGTTAKGYRTIYSAYDKHRDLIYVVSSAGHLWRIDYDDSDMSKTQWTSMLHSNKLMTKDRKEYLDFIHVVQDMDTLSRMIISYNDDMMYSDDEGRNWLASSGVDFQVTGNKGCMVLSNKGDRAVVLAKIDGSHKVAYSYDGINYAKCDLSINYNDYDTKILKPHFSEDVYVISRHKSTSKVTLYKMPADSEQFTLLHEVAQTMESPKRVMGTLLDGVHHFYYVIGNECYYSNNEGITWTKTVVESYGNKDGNTTARTMHPTKPNLLFRGYLDVYMSEDKGANYKGWSHKLGWDVHFMRMHQRKDGSYMHIISDDFGVFASYTPETKESYFSVNNTSPTQMAYDMDASDNFGTAFTALQDRGSRNFKNGDKPGTSEIRSTDGLRVTLANQEKSIWTWMYFGTVYHKPNSGYKSGDKCSKSISGSWTAGCMAPHPNPEKDAVIVAHGKKLKELIYNAASNSISVKEHHIDFNALTGQSATSFGSSPMNKDRWYVAVKDGRFFYSTDGGNTFTQSSSGALAKGNDQSYNYTRNQQVIKASKLNEETVYFAGVKNAFYISTDGGQTFTNHADGLDVWRIRDFELSDDEKYIFAACANAGVWVFSVEEDKWYKMDGPNVPYADFTGVNYTPSLGMVQFSSFGYGILDFKFSGINRELSVPSGTLAEAVSFSSIKLKWNIEASTAEGYTITRSSDLLTFEEVTSVSAATDSFVDVDLNPSSEYYYRIYAIEGESQSLPSSLISISTLDIEALNASAWALIKTSSNTEGNEGQLAFDENNSTAWETAATSYPQEIQIDLGSEHQLAAFTCIPTSKGVVKSYELYVSKDSLNWGSAVSSGEWISVEEVKKTIPFDKTQGRFVRFVALSGFETAENAAIAELKLWPGYDLRLEAPIELEYKPLGGSVIMLKWKNVSSNIDGYIIERLGDNGFEEIARLDVGLTTYLDTDLEPAVTYTYRVKAYRFEDESEASLSLQAKTLSPGLIARTYWQIIYVDSEEEGKGADLAIDNDEDTWWHSQFSPTKDPMPHELQIDMAKSESMVAFTYLPRTDSNENGTVAGFEFYISNDKDDWGTAVAKGTWNSKERQTVTFARTEGRYLRFVATSELNGKGITNCAEFMVWNEHSDASSIKERNDVDVQVYPNPFVHEINVTLHEKGLFHTAELLSSDGRVIYTTTIRGKSARLTPNKDLTSGLYLLRLSNNESAIIRRIIKQ